MRNLIGIFAVGALLLAACGDGAGTADTATTAAAEEPAAESTTTTTMATTTTTEADPDQVFADEVAARGLGGDLTPDDVLKWAASTCMFATEQEPDSPQSLEQFLNFRGGRVPGDNPGELVALAVEIYCPEHTGRLEFSSEQYSLARTAELTIGDCFLTGFYGLVPIDCAEPHGGEVVAFVDVSDKEYPADPQARSGFFDGVDCATPIADYAGEAVSLGYSTSLLALSQEDWDAGETQVMCSVTAAGPILVGSVQGKGSAINAVREAVSFSATTCTHEALEATLTNNGDVAVAVHFELSNYYPEGFSFETTQPMLSPGETFTISEQYDDPDTELPAECDRNYLSVVPVPLD